MNFFHSFIVTNFWLADLLEDVSCPPDWGLRVIDDPSSRFWVSRDGRGRSERSYPADIDEQYRIINKEVPAKEIIIEAKDQDTADNVLNLIETGIILVYPNSSDCPDEGVTVPVTGHSPCFMKDKPFVDRFSFHDSALYGCNAAEKAWGDNSLIYSMEKYKRSFRMDSFTPHSASPRYGQVFMNERNDYRYHVNAGFAIVIAYSVIEELGLEIRSSAKNPRFIDGEWNDKVHQDVADRLRDSGVEPGEDFTWILRGPATELQEEMWQHLKTVDDFSETEEVRDVEMNIIEALHAASILRNFIFAHRFDKVAESVSPYDVHNMQTLARRLILNTLGLFDVDDEKVTGIFRP